MRAGWKLAGSVVALAAALQGCGDSGYDGGGAAAPTPAACTAATATATTSIQITSTAFVPACARVPSGVEVTFTNADGIAHTVTSSPGEASLFDSGALAPGAQFRRTFAPAGTVRAHCTIHPAMRVTLLVE